MLSKFKYKIHQQHLAKLPYIPQIAENFKTLYSPKDFRDALMQAITFARNRIYLVILYLEYDHGGHQILEALYQTKKNNPTLEVAVLVDWHRAQRGRIGTTITSTNAEWYYWMATTHPNIDVPIYGVPVNTREALGVMHLKGFIIDDQVIYSGASINNTYLHQLDQYRYDRYNMIKNQLLADTLLSYIKQYLLAASAVNRLDDLERPKNIKIKHNIRLFRHLLKQSVYNYQGNIATQNELSIIPLVGLGKKSLLNTTIHHLICSTCDTLMLCTPYFNLPTLLMRNLTVLLHLGKKIEIIVGDKIANDFYIPEDQPFQIISILPYLYEINLRRFLERLQPYVSKGQLIVRLWKDGNNSYHLKGLWVDEKWQVLTGNNFNPRAWYLDLENALLIHDPQQRLRLQREQEQILIRTHTQIVKHFTDLQSIADYPVKVRTLIRRLRRIRIDRLISRIL
ncbi:CDP-diacylglycerol--serine O-phosphatidyltransferase [Candidatus Curculioniphilus buchneri]|uniref:CDP-diacylglycerol--serine O-phosphatidyltransferase n=1 Tax=Candidatus Curculioniphilus buchneri TaxID=690594 RepID=UPI00376F134B